MKGMKGLMKGHEEGQQHLIGILGLDLRALTRIGVARGSASGLHGGHEADTKGTTGNGKTGGDCD
jgi:hypothetical protein